MKTRTLFLLFLFAVLCYFPLFHHLDYLSLRMWDEARRGVNAIEMATNGNFLVTHYDGKPDMFGVKPPFLIWCQVFFIKLLGYNELAIRMPAAIAGLGTLMMLTVFSHRVLKKPLIGIFASLILLTSAGFTNTHITRTGDFEVLLLLFQNAYLLFFFCFFILKESPRRTKFLYLAAFMAVLAIMTKSIAACFSMPAIFLFAVFEKRIIGILKNKHLWFAVAGVIFLVGSFYLLRNHYNPGYLAMVWQEEIGGRFMTAIGGHDYPWYHYLENWIFGDERFSPWAFFLPLGIYLGWQTGGRVRLLTKLLTLNCLIFMLVVSSAGTKLPWYQSPAFPGLAMLVAFGLERLYQSLKDRLVSRELRFGSTPFLLLFVLAFWGLPYTETIIERTYLPQPSQWDGDDMKIGEFMNRYPQYDNYIINHRGYNSHALFYKKAFNLRGYNIKKQISQAFNPGDTVLICEYEAHQKLAKKYYYHTIVVWDACELREIRGKKPPRKTEEGEVKKDEKQ